MAGNLARPAKARGRDIVVGALVVDWDGRAQESEQDLRCCEDWASFSVASAM